MALGIYRMGAIYYKICIDSYDIYLLECFTSPLNNVNITHKNERITEDQNSDIMKRNLNAAGSFNKYLKEIVSIDVGLLPFI